VKWWRTCAILCIQWVNAGDIIWYHDISLCHAKKTCSMRPRYLLNGHCNWVQKACRGLHGPFGTCPLIVHVLQWVTAIIFSNQQFFPKLVRGKSSGSLLIF
jgi:hypothetical protein